MFSLCCEVQSMSLYPSIYVSDNMCWPLALISSTNGYQACRLGNKVAGKCLFHLQMVISLSLIRIIVLSDVIFLTAGSLTVVLGAKSTHFNVFEMLTCKLIIFRKVID